MWGFQVCIDNENLKLTSFRLQLAYKYGTDDFIDLNPVGPGKEDCARYALGDPINEPLDTLTVYLEDDLIVGVALATSIKTGQFGLTSSAETKQWRFSRVYPLIGLWGFNSDEGISALGVIRFDTESECYTDLQAGSISFSEVQDSAKSEE